MAARLLPWTKSSVIRDQACLLPSITQCTPTTKFHAYWAQIKSTFKSSNTAMTTQKAFSTYLSQPPDTPSPITPQKYQLSSRPKTCLSCLQEPCTWHHQSQPLHLDLPQCPRMSNLPICYPPSGIPRNNPAVEGDGRTPTVTFYCRNEIPTSRNAPSMQTSSDTPA